MLASLPKLAGYLSVTLFVTLLSVVPGLILAALLAVWKDQGSRIVSGGYRIFISFIRSTPFIVQLFVVYFGVPQLLSGAGVDVSDLPPRSVITADYLREQNGTIRSADFVLFYTGWERKWGTGAYYDDDFPVPDQEAAKYLVSCGLKGVGTDALSVDTLRDQQFLAHKTLLDGGLVILESLCLKKVVGRTDLMLFALPLKFENADGAPVRAIAEFRDFPEEKEMEAL